IWDKQEELNGYIRKYAIGWSLERISKTARAIMQLAMYECLYVEDVPVSAAINEAVELTRKYEDEDVVAFVNGILGSFAREVAEQ
ncbi:MAG: transcription antitermination protein NusB, partial [Oscillospiraceae bacterium]|nr:transcription antitermination protein NusB [Oscillospiraceae bacterium]